MLVLSRKRQQQIMIGQGAGLIVLTVIEIRGNLVRLGIEAPKETAVHRAEIYQRIHPEAQPEASTDVSPMA